MTAIHPEVKKNYEAANLIHKYEMKRRELDELLEKLKQLKPGELDESNREKLEAIFIGKAKILPICRIDLNLKKTTIRM